MGSTGLLHKGLGKKDPRDAANVRGHGHQPQEVDDVTQAIARLGRQLLRFLLPGAGRHRAPNTGPLAPRHVAAGDVPAVWPRRPAPPVLLSGEDPWLIRPYVLTPEERQARRTRRHRRRTLWLAVHGIDAGPRHIHGAEVPAA